MEPVELNFTVYHLFRLLDVGIVPTAVFWVAAVLVAAALLFRLVLLWSRSDRGDSGRRAKSLSFCLTMVGVVSIVVASVAALSVLSRYVMIESYRQFCLDAVQGGRAPRLASRYLDELEALAVYPAWCAFQRAVVAMQQGHFSEAADRFSKIVASEPNNEVAWLNLIQCEISAGRLARADDNLNRCRESFGRLAPGKMAALTIRLRQRQGRHREARALIEEAIRAGHLPSTMSVPGQGGGQP